MLVGRLGPFCETKTGHCCHLETVHQGRNLGAMVLLAQRGCELPSMGVHFRCVRLTPIRDGFIAFQVRVNGCQEPAERLVGWAVVAKVRTGKEGKKAGNGINVFLDGLDFDLASSDGAALAKGDSVSGELELASVSGGVLQEQVISPIHREGEAKVEQPAGTKCPKCFGRTHGCGLGSQDSLDERSSRNSGLGRK